MNPSANHSETPLTIHLNGQRHLLATPCSLQGLLESLGVCTTGVAVELNLRVITRSALADTPLADGDSVEIVEFIGGG